MPVTECTYSCVEYACRNWLSCHVYVIHITNRQTSCVTHNVCTAWTYVYVISAENVVVADSGSGASSNASLLEGGCMYQILAFSFIAVQ